MKMLLITLALLSNIALAYEYRIVPVSKAKITYKHNNHKYYWVSFNEKEGCWSHDNYWFTLELLDKAKADGVEQVQIETRSCTITRVRKGPTQKEYDKHMHRIGQLKKELQDCHKLHSCDVSKTGLDKGLDDIDKALKAYKPFTQADSFSLPNMLKHAAAANEVPASSIHYVFSNYSYMKENSGQQVKFTKGVHLDGIHVCGEWRDEKDFQYDFHHLHAAKLAGEKVILDRKNCTISRVKGPSQEDYDKLTQSTGQLEKDLQKCKKGH